MKNKIKNILSNNGIIVLDTNAYLNIYDRSPEFSNFSISVLDCVKDKIYLPHIVKKEFLRNHKECYNRQKKKIEKACDKLSSLLNSTNQKINNQCLVIKSFQFPDIEEVQKRLIEKLSEAKQIVDEYADDHDILTLINNVNLEKDSVMELVQWLIDNGNVMGELSIYDLYELAPIADKRFANKVPPGFRDEKKDYELGKYGDFFVWDQTIKFAKEKSLPVIFVTDDKKSDWYEKKDGDKCFHSKLYDEFQVRVGNDFLGIDSLTFLDAISEIYGIEKTSATICALEFTADKYIDSLIKDLIIYDNFDELLYSSEKFVDMDSLSASATEGLEISDEIENAKFSHYEIGEFSDVSATYYLHYHLKVKATSYEYWGRDDDTKEIITSPGRVHILDGDVVLEVIREVDDYAIVDGDSTYQSARIVSGTLKEVDAYDVDQLCFQCGKNIGEYQDYYGNPICGDCMKSDNYGEICTSCGRKIPLEYMSSDNCCNECAEHYDG